MTWDTWTDLGHLVNCETCVGKEGWHPGLHIDLAPHTTLQSDEKSCLSHYGFKTLRLGEWKRLKSPQVQPFPVVKGREPPKAKCIEADSVLKPKSLVLGSYCLLQEGCFTHTQQL